MQGEKTSLSLTPDMYHGPRLSPDGSHLVLIKGPPSLDVYVCDLTGPSMTKITNNPSFDLWPIWEPTGNRITYSSSRASNLLVPSLYSILPDMKSTYAVFPAAAIEGKYHLIEVMNLFGIHPVKCFTIAAAIR